MGKVSPSINLLKTNNDFLDRFINWALTVGRGLVVLTELIALTAFVYRFSLDRKLIDLHSQIKREVAIVVYLKNNEEKYRNLQDRLEISSSFSNSSIKRVKIFNDVTSFAPKDISFNSINVNKNRLNINANANSTASITRFINSLKKYSYTQTLSLDSIESKPSSTIITVSITASLK